MLSVGSPPPRLVLDTLHIHTSMSLTHSLVGSRFLLTGNARPSLKHSAPIRSVSILNTTPALSGVAQNTVDKALCLLCHFASVWQSILGISYWVRNVIENGYMLQFWRRPPRFNGVVMSTVPAHSEPVLRQEVLNLLAKRAIEVVPSSERESGFYSRYFVVPKKGGGLRPILDLRPINRVLYKPACKRQR